MSICQTYTVRHEQSGGLLSKGVRSDTFSNSCRVRDGVSAGVINYSCRLRDGVSGSVISHSCRGRDGVSVGHGNK